MDHYTLFTNLRFVTLNGVRTFTRALLLEPSEDLLNRGTTAFGIRGFGTDAAWPVFDVRVPSLEYTSATGESADLFVSGEGEPRPLATGAILRFKDGPEVQLLAEDGRQAIDIMEFAPDADIRDVWDVLPRKVAEYYGAPNMPVLNWVRADDVRVAARIDALARELRR